MQFRALLAAVAALSIAQAAPTTSTHSLHQKRSPGSSQWIRRSRVEESALLPMRIALTQRDLHKGYSLVMDV